MIPRCSEDAVVHATLDTPPPHHEARSSLNQIPLLLVSPVAPLPTRKKTNIVFRRHVCFLYTTPPRGVTSTGEGTEFDVSPRVQRGVLEGAIVCAEFRRAYQLRLHGRRSHD